MEVPEGFPQTRPEPPQEPEPDLPPGSEVPAGGLVSLPDDVDIEGTDRNTIIDMLSGTEGGSVLMAGAPVFGYPGMTVLGSPPIQPGGSGPGKGSEPTLTSGETDGILGVPANVPAETTGETEPGEGSLAEEQLGVDESQVTDDMLPAEEAEASGEGDNQEEAGAETETEPGSGTEVTGPPEKQNVRWSVGDVVLEEVVDPDGTRRVVVVDRARWNDGTTTVNIDYDLDTGDPLRGSASGQGDKFGWNASQTDNDEFNFNLNRLDPNRPGVGSLELHGGGGQEASGSIKGRYDDAEWSAEQTPDDRFNASWNRFNQQDSGIRHGEVHAGGGQDFSANLSGGYGDANWEMNYDQDKFDAWWRRTDQNDPGLRFGDVHAGGGQDFSANLRGGYSEADWNLSYNQDRLDASWNRLDQTDAGLRQAQVHAGGGQDFSMSMQGGSRGLNWQANYSEQGGFSADLATTREDTVFQRVRLGDNPELDLRVQHSRNIDLDLNLREGGSGATVTHRPSGISVSYGRDGWTGPLDNLKEPDMPGPGDSLGGSDERFLVGGQVRF
jgi:hypothetical protein